jgi:hypothetical protein
LIGARYKDKKPHFEISVKLPIFNPISTYKKIFSDFFLLKTHFRIGRHENKEKLFSTLVLELFCQSIANCMILKIQKIQKSTSPIIQGQERNLTTLVSCTLILIYIIQSIICYPMTGEDYNKSGLLYTHLSKGRCGFREKFCTLNYTIF